MSSGFHACLLLHNIRNAKNYLLLSLNLSGVNEEAHILCIGGWIKTFGDSCLKAAGLHQSPNIEYLNIYAYNTTKST